jgi:hypothetical protein
LPEADFHVRNCPLAGFGLGVHPLGCPQMSLFGKTASVRPGQAKAWTPNLLAVIHSVFCSPKRPATGLFRGIPTLTGKKWKFFENRDRAPYRLCTTPPVKTSARMSRSERLHSGQIPFMIRLRIYWGAVMRPGFD